MLTTSSHMLPPCPPLLPTTDPGEWKRQNGDICKWQSWNEQSCPSTIWFCITTEYLAISLSDNPFGLTWSLGTFSLFPRPAEWLILGLGKNLNVMLSNMLWQSSEWHCSSWVTLDLESTISCARWRWHHGMVNCKIHDSSWPPLLTLLPIWVSESLRRRE